MNKLYYILVKVILLFSVIIITHYNFAMDSCSLNTGQLHFGDYSAVKRNATKSRARIQVRCNGSGSYSLALSRGHGAFSRRKMTSTLDHLYYNIFTDATRTQIWGDGTGNTGLIHGSYQSRGQSFSRTNHNIYGAIYPSQDAYPGIYTDDLFISFTF